MIQKIDTRAAKKRIQCWTERMKRVLNRRSNEDNKNKNSSISQDWKPLTNFVKRGKAPPISAVLIPQRDEEAGGIDAVNRKYAVETSDILQQIEQQWEPISNREKEADFGDFLTRFRDHVEVQQCELPELTGGDLRRKAKELSSTRSVALCGWRTQEIKALPGEIFDLLAILLKQIETNQQWPEILLQVVTTLIPKIESVRKSWRARHQKR